MPTVTLATCAELPDGDEDAALLGDALAACGVTARWRSWDDPSAPWDEAPVVLRATWDYATRLAEFLAWADAVPRLANDARTVRWNTDKTYLRDLAAAGVAIVPTTFAAPGEPIEVLDVEIVVKPSVGAGSRGAGRFTPERAGAAREHAAALQDAGRTVLVQPYLGDVDTEGETALVYFAGEYSHAASKSAMLPPGVAHPVAHWELFVAETIEAREATPAQRAVADAALAVASGRFGVPLYARVDLLPTADGPVVIELELTEPSLFLAQDRGAPDRFAAAIAAVL